MLLLLLFASQGSLYELDKVSVIHAQRFSGRLFVRIQTNVFVCFAASQSHREVYASLGVPSQQGVCAAANIFHNYKHRETAGPDCLGF